MTERKRGLPSCAAAHHDCDFRDVLSRIGDKWSLLVILMLEKMPDQRARFSDLKRTIPGISQRMLTATLRSLERDGMLTRHVFPEVPPRVEYRLTEKGLALLPVIDTMREFGKEWLPDEDCDPA